MRRPSPQHSRPVYTGKYRKHQIRRRRQTILAVAILIVLILAGAGIWWLSRTVPVIVDEVVDRLTVSKEEKVQLSEAFNKRLVRQFPHLANDSLLYFGAPNYTFETWAREAKNQPRLLPIVKGSEDIPLRRKLAAMLAAYPAHFKPHLFYYYPGDHSFVDINAYSAVPAASVIKLPVLLAYFHSLDRELIQWESPLLYLEYHRAGGAGGLQYGPTGVIFPSHDIVRQMIQVSDNTATNIMISYLGGSDFMNRFLRGAGLRQTVIRNWLPDLSGTNTVSMYEMAVILNNIDSGLILSRQSREQALDILKGTHNWRLLAAPLPRRQLDFAHKTGDIGRALADVGVVYLPDGRKYVIAMQVDRPFNDYTARDMIQEASQIIYNHVLESKPVPEPITEIRAEAKPPAMNLPPEKPEDPSEFLPVDAGR